MLQHLFDLIYVIFRQHNRVCSRHPYSLFLLAFLLPLIHLNNNIKMISIVKIVFVSFITTFVIKKNISDL